MSELKTRRATDQDAEGLSVLLRDYLRERYPSHHGTSIEQLRRDVLGDPGGQRLAVGQRGSDLVGFIAWDRVYDLHWGLKGVQIADLYVVPAFRGRGIALMLLVGMCAEARSEGAAFLRGSSYDRRSATGRFYERLAIGSDSAECHCAGRAFRQLAGLHGKPARVIVRSLPPREWNYMA